LALPARLGIVTLGVRATSLARWPPTGHWVGCDPPDFTSNPALVVPLCSRGQVPAVSLVTVVHHLHDAERAPEPRGAAPRCLCAQPLEKLPSLFLRRECAVVTSPLGRPANPEATAMAVE
jgi:hypothetical protein